MAAPSLTEYRAEDVERPGPGHIQHGGSRVHCLAILGRQAGGPLRQQEAARRIEPPEKEVRTNGNTRP
jgi:hypothetical protein